MADPYTREWHEECMDERLHDLADRTDKELRRHVRSLSGRGRDRLLPEACAVCAEAVRRGIAKEAARV